MKELVSRTILYEAFNRPPSIKYARKFVESAIESGVINKINESKKKNKTWETSWERAKFLLFSYLDYPKLTQPDLSIRAGGVTPQRVSQIIIGAVKDIWKASPDEIKFQYPLGELLYVINIAKLSISGRERYRRNRKQSELREHGLFPKSKRQD